MDLLNFIVSHSQFPGNVQDMWLTMFHKLAWANVIQLHGQRPNDLAQLSAGTIRCSKITDPGDPGCNTAGRPNCDVMCYLSTVKLYANCHKQTIFALQRDQMKGFDYLHPPKAFMTRLQNMDSLLR
jgi:hypothetical protein